MSHHKAPKGLGLSTQAAFLVVREAGGVAALGGGGVAAMSLLAERGEGEGILFLAQFRT